MTTHEKRRFVRNLCNAVRDHLLSESARWPEAWDGHELRELIAREFDGERTPLMLRSRSRRRRECHNDIITLGL